MTLMCYLRLTRSRTTLESSNPKFINSLEFDECDLVSAYVAYVSDNERIVASRGFNFGVPMMESCGYTAETLWNAVKVEGGVEEAASAYGVHAKTVQVALDYLESLKPAA
jgi:uncharacterized protein (DUF433 family)